MADIVSCKENKEIFHQGGVLDKRYILDAKIGKGGFSHVWSAINDTNGDKVAIKIYKPFRDNFSYFEHEIRVLRAIHRSCTENIEDIEVDDEDLHVKSTKMQKKCNKSKKNRTKLNTNKIDNFYSIEEKNARLVNYRDTFDVLYCKTSRNHFHRYNTRILRYPCIVYEQLGQDLDKFMENLDSGLPYDLAKRILKEVTTGLKYLHKANLIHNDIKPDNVFIIKPYDQIIESEDVSVKLGDFGAAIFEDKIHSCRLGTDGYRSPEMLFTDLTNISCESDIWSLGMLFYYLITNEHMLDDITEMVMIGEEAEDSFFESDSTESDSEMSDDESEEIIPDEKLDSVLVELHKIEKIFGKIPNLYKRGKLYDDLCRDGKLYPISRYGFCEELKPEGVVKLGDFLENNYDIDALTAGNISELILKMVKYKPEKRASLKELMLDLEKRSPSQLSMSPLL